MYLTDPVSGTSIGAPSRVDSSFSALSADS